MVADPAGQDWLAHAPIPEDEYLAVRYGRTYRRRRVSWTLPITVATLGLAAAFAGQYLIVLPHMEQDLTTRINETLKAAGLPGVTATVDGRDVTLNGTVTKDADVDTISNLVTGVEGVRVVRVFYVQHASAPANATPAPAVSPSRSPG